MLTLFCDAGVPFSAVPFTSVPFLVNVLFDCQFDAVVPLVLTLFRSIDFGAAPALPAHHPPLQSASAGVLSNVVVASPPR